MKKGFNPLKKSVAVAISVLMLAACGSTTTQDANTASAESSSFPVTISNNGNDVIIAAKPVAIVSLSPTATEMLFAIGAGDQVIAVDDQSTFPAEAPITDLSGFTPNIEAIVAKQPDLVIVSNDIDNVIAALQSANIPVLLEGAASNLDDTYAQIIELGLATGQEQGAAELVASMKAEIGTAVASLKKPMAPLTYYHELDPTLYTVTSATFIGQLYALAGLENIADAAPDAETGYPQLSAEYLIKSNPQLIFLADTKCCSVTAEQLLTRPGFSSLDAVKNGLVIELDDDVASRWGPRTTELFAAIIEAINKVTTS